MIKESNNTWFIDRLTLYQNANSDPQSVKKNFLIRTAEFELIIAALRDKRKDDPLQHELILGRRGSGKSTLLRRIQIEIDEQVELSEKYIAINLAEEQNAVYRLSDLWFEVLRELGIRLHKSLELKDFDTFEDGQAYARYLYGEIHALLLETGKKAVLLLDNLDRILENFDDDAHLLREILLNYNDIQIIGGSTRMNEHFWRYDQPFYDFFRRHRLEGLSFEEVRLLLDHWGTEMKLPTLQGYSERHPGRVEAIRILTDGLPRALLYFIQVLIHDSDLYGYDYLKKVMDHATPLYQERLHNLTPPQRKIVQELAFHWEAAPTKVLVEKCRMESKLIASYLKQLDQFGIVETLETGKKNHLYRLSERFFNMWLIVTQGNPDQKRRARYLTLFLESWYGERELQDLFQRHLADMAAGKIAYDKAMVLSKGLAQSKVIGIYDRDELIEATLALEPDSVYRTELPRRAKEIIEEYKIMYESGRYNLALEKLEELENEEDGSKFMLQALCHVHLEHYQEMEKFFEMAAERGVDMAFDLLANYYFGCNAFPKKALELMERYIERTNDFSHSGYLILYEIWNGIFLDLPKRIDAALTNIVLAHKNDVEHFLVGLLCLNQPHLAQNCFDSPQHGKQLKAQFEPLYYATLILCGNTENNLLLRIPPELMSTVQDIISKTKEKQAFYAQKPVE